ncbi:MAG: replicative DNA helicase, partial [Patescibacteria group bacterium]|nr:replicative DNA helicase [Patescibacteria group bacterium]
MDAAKLPPQSLEAEQSVLGGILLDRSLIFAVQEFLAPEDFARDGHRLVFSAMLRLAERGEPCDLGLVLDELQRNDQLQAAGAAAYLHSLPGMCSSPLFVEHYAKAVKRTALKRKLITLGGDMARIGYDDALSVEDALDRAAEALAEIANARLDRHTGLFGITDIHDDIQRLYESGWNLGVSTGWAHLDDYYRPVPGDWTLVGGWPSHGKALALTTKLPTPTGWTTMGEVKVGDQLFDEQGNTCVVTRATEVMFGRPCYAVEFNDGTVIVADAEHQWLTYDAVARRSEVSARKRERVIPGLDQRWKMPGPKVLTTAQIAETLVSE